MTNSFTRLLSALIICLLFCTGGVYAQSPVCGTERAMEEYYRLHPSAKARMQDYEKYLQRIQKEVVTGNARHARAAGPADDTCAMQLFVIPVVFHVFYGDSPEAAARLVPMSQLQSALDIANEDFNMRNKQLISTIDPLFAPIAARMRVKFVMAKKDPQGQPTQGATYHAERRFFGDATREAEDSVAKYAWDNYKYCNVYVMNYLEHNNKPMPKATFKVSKQETDIETKQLITGENSQQFFYVGENYFSGGAVTLNVYTPKVDLRNVQRPLLTFSDNLSWDPAYPTSRPEDKSTTILVAEALNGPWQEVQTIATSKSDFNRWLPRQVDLSAWAGKQVYINFRRNKHHFYYALDNVCIKAAGTTACTFTEGFESAAAGALPAGWTTAVTDYNYDANNSGIAWYPDKGMNDRKTSRIVFNGWYLGMGGISTNNRSFNSTFSHELGHWLNLKHTFDGNNCAGAGDGVDDTPSTNVAGGGCNATVCGHKINGENFMDYNTTCYKMFTAGQMSRATQAMYHVARKSIWQLSNLEATGVRNEYDNVCPPRAVFSMDVESVLAGVNTTVTFTDASVHFPASWEWTIDNGSGTPVILNTATATAVFNKKGTYNVTLKVKNQYGENTLTKTISVVEKSPSACKQGEDFNYSALGSLPAGWTKQIPAGNFAVAKVSKTETVDLDGPMVALTAKDNSGYLFIGENFNSETNSADEVNVITQQYQLAGIKEPALYFVDNLAWDKSWPDPRPDDRSTTILAATSLAGPWETVATLSTNKSLMGKWNDRKMKLPASFTGKDVYIRIRRNQHHFFYAFDDMCIKEWDGTVEPEPEPSMGADCKAGENFNTTLPDNLAPGWTQQVPATLKGGKFRVSKQETVRLVTSMAYLKAADNSNYLFLGENYDDAVNNAAEVNVYSGKLNLAGIVKPVVLFADNLSWDLAWPEARPEDKATTVYVAESLTGPWTSVAVLTTDKAAIGQWNERKIDLSAFTGKTVYLRISRNKHHYFYAADDFCVQSGVAAPDPEPSMGTGCKAGENFDKMTVGQKPGGWTIKIPGGNKAAAKIAVSENVSVDGKQATIKSSDNSPFLILGENFNDDLNGIDELNLITNKVSLKGLTKSVLTFADNLAWDPSWPDPRPEDKATTLLVATAATGPWDSVTTFTTTTSRFKLWNDRTVDLSKYDGKDIYIRFRRNAHHYYYALENLCVKNSGDTDPDPEPSMGKDCKAGENFDKMKTGAAPAGWKSEIPAGNKAAAKITASENVSIDGAQATIKSSDNSPFLILGENFNDDLNGVDELSIITNKISLKGLTKAVFTFSDNLAWDPSWPDPRPEDKATTLFVATAVGGPWDSVTTFATTTARFKLWNDRTVDLSKYDGKDIYIRFRRNAHHYYYALENLCVKNSGSTNPDPDPEPSMGKDCKAGENFDKMKTGAAPAGWKSEIPAGNKAAAKITASENVSIDGAQATIKSSDNSPFLILGENFNDDLNGVDELSIITNKISLKGLTKAVFTFSDNLAWDPSWPDPRPEDKATTLFVATAVGGPWDSVTTFATTTARFKLWNDRTVDLSKYDGKDIYIRFRRNAHHYYYAVENLCVKNSGGTNPDPDPEPSMGKDCKAGENFDKMKTGAAPAGWKNDIPAGNKATVNISTSENVNIDGMKATIKAADNSPYLFLGENFNDAGNGPDEMSLYSSKISLKDVKDAELHFVDNLAWDPTWPADKPDDNATTIFVGLSQSGPWDSITFLGTNKANFTKWNARTINLKAYDGKDIYIRIRRNAHHFYYAMDDICIKGSGGSTNPEPGDCKTGENFDNTAAGSKPAGWTENIPAGMTVSYKVTSSANVDIDGTPAVIKGKDQSPYLFVGENFNAGIDAPDEINLYTPKISLKDLKTAELHFTDNLAWDAAWPAPRPEDKATTIFVSASLTGQWDSITVLSTDKANFKNWNERTVNLTKYAGKEIFIRIRRNAHHYYYAIDGICIKGTTGPVDPGVPVQPELGRGAAFGLMVTPNPVAKNMRITFLNRTPGTVSFQVIDMSGRIMMHGKLQSAGRVAETHDLPAASLQPGVYILKLQNREVWESQRFIKL
ncbi:M43 family zinc metalloprotease [Chitinophaga solisilvae]|uniref:M43 family zinc metalloprotease n=1 Tax=Chitinophaga solisilvae TaxID=1233460 RepID=UPI00136E0B0B|nr:M43 family zinc metalloprotease [Chitinophaga solisilvae]